MTTRKPASAPTIFIILGATGDLAKRKLFPALFHLHQKHLLPNRFRVIGFGRRALTDRTFHSLLTSSHALPQKGAGRFCKKISYFRGDLTHLSSYSSLAQEISRIILTWNQCPNILFYLATPPPLYLPIISRLSKSGIAHTCSPQEGWSRILIEKPFGKDAASARAINRSLSSLFRESQIYRVDHYLARETIQNILTFRFSNSLFKPAWNTNYIERICITLHEKEGVRERGALYDTLGALRDVGQNHLLQMLALVTMNNPREFSCNAIRKERARVLGKLARPRPRAIASFLRGQYRGYTRTAGVKPSSRTETYFRITARINAPLWKKTDFILESGKALAENRKEISVVFRPTVPCFCPPSHSSHMHQNAINFLLEPKEEIRILFWAKKPGFSLDTFPASLPFSSHRQRALSPYEKLVHDALEGDQTFFASSEEEEAAWRFITPILTQWKRGKPFPYQPGLDPATLVS